MSASTLPSRTRRSGATARMAATRNFAGGTNKVGILPPGCYREAKNGGALIFLARLQFRGGKGRFVRRIGEVLCLEAEPRPPAIYLAAFSLDRAVQEIAGIELHSRLRRADFENPPGRRFF